MTEKRKKYLLTKEEIFKTIDNLGCEIDEEIREVVIFLNLLGIETTASCQGHTNWGLKHFWVDFIFDEYDKMNQLLKGCFKDKRPFEIDILGDYNRYICRLQPIMKSKRKESKINLLKFEKYLKRKYFKTMD